MLSDEKVREAVGQMIAHCRLLMEQEYQFVSARSVLYDLGFEADVDQVLDHIASRGFDYHLDHSIRNPDGEYPSKDSCYWGVDQLESRLRCV